MRHTDVALLIRAGFSYRLPVLKRGRCMPARARGMLLRLLCFDHSTFLPPHLLPSPPGFSQQRIIHSSMTSSAPTDAPVSEQKSKIEWDDDSDGPYIPIPGQSDWRLTPLRQGDEVDLVRICTDPGTARWAYHRPTPYVPRFISCLPLLFYTLLPRLLGRTSEAQCRTERCPTRESADYELR